MSDARPERSRRLAASAALFAVATGLSRVLGLAREALAAYLLGARGIANSFTNANQVPNVARSLVADAALGGAFVPIFNELLDRGEERRAWRVASTVLTVSAVGLAALTALGIVLARPLVSALFPGEHLGLTVELARLVFPTVILLGLSGIVNAMLNSFDEFFVPAIAPVAWNLVICGFLVAALLTPADATRVKVYTIGVVVGTIVQFVLPLPWLRGRGGRLQIAWDVHDPAVRQVFALMLPITLGLGLINVNVLIDTIFANAFQADFGPRAIETAFRVYMLPQGMFSVAVAAVLFPTLSRLASAGDLPGFRDGVANGLRQILFLLVPASIVCAVLAEPIVRLLFEHGRFRPDQTPGVAAALAGFSLGLAANGVILLLNRAFFSLQRPWLPTTLAVANLAVNALLDWALYRRGVWGVPLSTSLGNLLFAGVLYWLLRRQVGPLGLRATSAAAARILTAGAVLAAVAYGSWAVLDSVLGRSILAQLVTMLVVLTAAATAYLATARALGLGEVELVAGLLRRLLGRR